MWNGRVCQDARTNSACLALKRTAENRNDAYEASCAGTRFDDMDKAPPCLSERGGFLSPFPVSLPTKLDYADYSADHRHILPQSVHVPAYGGVLTPYRWMLREHAWKLADAYGIEASEGNEPKKGEAPDLIVDTAWVQDCDNQSALLEGFAGSLSEASSLIFFYAKQTPLTDSARRQIVAVAKLATLGKVAEYPYEGGGADGRIRSMIWERPFQHTLRPDPEEEGAWLGGVVLPYHALIARAAAREDLDVSGLAAEVPDDAYDQFLYGTDHVTHGSAISSLQSVRASLEAVSNIIPGPWARYIEWIDRELSELWSMQGPAPGLGSALSCFDPHFNGTLFAHALAGELADGADPWPIVDEIFDDRRKPPTGAPRITTMQRKRWQHLHRTDPEGMQLMRLLACFELTRDQAKAAFDGDEVEAILDNPYRLYELSRNTADPIALGTVDRSMFPTDAATVRPALPEGMSIDLEEPEHPLRLRALVIAALEKAAADGDTILSAKRLTGIVEALPLSAPVSVDETALEICADDFSPEVAVTVQDGAVFAQLVRYVEAGEIIGRHVGSRIGAGKLAIQWRPLVEKEFGAPARADADEIAAQDEKVRALEVLETSRIGVLTGPAGTGKTTLLKIFLDQKKIAGSDVLLLAPTGKARVRLGQQTKRPDQARTLAQFLLEHGRYDADTGRYVVVSDGATAAVSTCVVDECSMLTEDQLAALCTALPISARLILVGDPQQLPPIGAGRPFVDIIAHLRDEHAGAGLADLTVSRRQAGDDLVPALSLPDVQLANLFSGRPSEPGEDEIACETVRQDGERLKLLTWDTPATLRERLLDVLALEFEAQGGELEAELELSLGGTRSGEFIYFNRGCGTKAESWQILSAHRNMASGSAELNRFMKQTVRSARLDEARRRRRGWRMIEPRGSDQITYGDKVICLRNHSRGCWSKQGGRQRGYLANGEMGMVHGDSGEHRLVYTNVEFASQPGETYGFSRKDFSDEGSPYIELAYSVTVHKAQGSEFGTVILVMPENSRLLSREMLYTALTRQKNRVWVLHQGNFGNLLRLRSDFFSETKRRSTNLFGLTLMQEMSVVATGGLRTGWLAAKLIHATRRGDLVSSKSELVIADILNDFEQRQRIRYSFEKPLTDATGATRWPDFTIEKGQDVWYWEHCGLMGQPQYRERWARKKHWYAAQGITEWSPANSAGRLIVTEDSLAGGIDSGSIARLAETLFGG